MMKLTRKFLSVLMVLCLLVGSWAMPALATESTGEGGTEPENTTQETVDTTEDETEDGSEEETEEVVVYTDYVFHGKVFERVEMTSAEGELSTTKVPVQDVIITVKDASDKFIEVELGKKLEAKTSQYGEWEMKLPKDGTYRFVYELDGMTFTQPDDFIQYTYDEVVKGRVEVEDIIGVRVISGGEDETGGDAGKAPEAGSGTGTEGTGTEGTGTEGTGTGEGDGEDTTDYPAAEKPGTVMFMTAQDAALEQGSKVQWGLANGASYYLVQLLDKTTLEEVGEETRVDGATEYTVPELTADHAYMLQVTSVSAGEKLKPTKGDPAMLNFSYKQAEGQGSGEGGDGSQGGDGTQGTEGQNAEGGTPEGGTREVPTMEGFAARTARVVTNPVLSAVGSSVVATSLALNWTAADTATKYDVYGGYVGGTAAVLATDVEALTTNYTPATVGAYKFFVKVKDGTNINNESNQIVVEVITSGFTPYTAWITPANATVPLYNSPAKDGTSTIAKDTAVTVLSRSADNLLAFIKYGASNYGFVDLANITLHSPVKLSAPTNLKAASDTSGALVNITWTQEDTRAEAYDVKLYVNSSNVLVHSAVVSTTKYDYAGALVAGTEYRIEVKATKPSTGSAIANSDIVSTTYIRTPITNAMTKPTLNGAIKTGYLYVSQSSATWDAIAGNPTFDWKIFTSAGVLVSENTVATNSIPASVFTGLNLLTDGSASYTLAVRTHTMNNVASSEWVYATFKMVPTTAAFINAFTVADTVTVGATVTFTLEGLVLPAKATLHYRLSTSTTENTAPLTVTDKKVTFAFGVAGVYEVWFDNGSYPVTPAKTILVKDGAAITISPISTKEKGTAFEMAWTAVAGATSYTVTIGYLEGVPVTATTIEAKFTVPATTISKIGPYYAMVQSNGTVVGTSAHVYFDVVDGTYKSFTGKAKEDSTNTYMTPSTNLQANVVLSKGDEVTVIGELNSYYHIRIGSVGSTAVRLFVPKTALSGSSSSSGGSSGSGGGTSGGGSSGGSTGTRPGAGGTAITTTTYKEAFGTEAVRKNSYEYVAALYTPLMEAMEKEEVKPGDRLELLATTFAALPNELNSEQYADVRVRSAWNSTTAFLTMLLGESLADGDLGQQNTLQNGASKVVSLLDEVLNQPKPIDDAIKAVMEEVRTQASTIAASSVDGSLSGTKDEVVIAILTKVLENKEYDEEIFPVIQAAFKAEDIVPDEPLEVRLLRTQMALTEYEQTKLTVAMSALEESAKIADINEVQGAYLDYVFAVGKLHMIAYAFGGATAEIVVQNWGLEIARLIAVNKVYNTFAQS